MEEQASSGQASLRKHFGALTDPRIDRQKRHELFDIVVITICAVICDADGWTEVEAFGKAHEGWLKTFLKLPNGIPSHDTFGRVFSLLDAQQLQTCFVGWVGELARLNSILIRPTISNDRNLSLLKVDGDYLCIQPMT